MGRQTGIVATETDEQAFLAFLRQDAEIQILVAVAATPEEVWVADFAPYDRFHTQYFIWNKAFQWQPRFRPLNDSQFVRVEDIATAPVLEFDRTNTDWLFRPGNDLLVAGSRLYWCKNHMSNRLAYNVSAFGKWYDKVIRWVRKCGRNDSGIAGSPYLLPDAWKRWEQFIAPSVSPTQDVPTPEQVIPGADP